MTRLPVKFEQWIDLAKAVIQPLPKTTHSSAEVETSVLRLDLLHPTISGNKWFKLKYHLEKVIEKPYKGIITSGGAYSNHLHAVAAAGKMFKIPVAAFIRGEAPDKLAPTLQDITDDDVQLEFMSREDFRSETTKQQLAATLFPNYHYIPEGGLSEEGILGASSILETYPLNNYDYIVGAMGTGTMMAGILRAANAHQTIIGIPVIKISDVKNNTLEQLLQAQRKKAAYRIFYEYAQQGYGKINPPLIQFMNSFYEQTQIPLDCVYTAKLFMAYDDLLQKGFFNPKSSVLLIHSGGLQGNRSIASQLLFH